MPVTSKPMPRPHPLEQGHVPFPAAAEMEIVADDDFPRVQAANEDLSDEVLRGLGRAFGVEAHHERQVGPGRTQELELLVEVCQQQRRRTRADDARGVAVKGHDHGLGADLVGSPTGPLDEPAVADVDAVVRTDRHH